MGSTDSTRPGFEVRSHAGLFHPPSQFRVCGILRNLFHHTLAIISLHQSTGLSPSSYHLSPLIPISGCSSALAHTHTNTHTVVSLSLHPCTTASVFLPIFKYYKVYINLPYASAVPWIVLSDSVYFYGIMPARCCRLPFFTHWLNATGEDYIVGNNVCQVNSWLDCLSVL